MRRTNTRKLSVISVVFCMLFASFSSVIPQQIIFAEGVDSDQSIITYTEEQNANVTEGKGSTLKQSIDLETEGQDTKSAEAQGELVEPTVPTEDENKTELETEPNVTDSTTPPTNEMTPETVEIPLTETTQETVEGQPTETAQETSEINPAIEPDKPSTEQTTKEEVVIDYNNLPELLVTEIMPNNLGADEYEYFEVYNNSDQQLVLDHHTFAVRYTDSSNKADVNMVFEPVVIDSKETLVFWLNVKNKSLSDFNLHYQTSLIEDQVVEYSGAPGFYNSGNRAVVIKSHSSEDIVFANYLKEDIGDGLVVNFSYPIDGIEMQKFETKVTPTPGVTKPGQVPTQTVISEKNEVPTIDHTPVTAVTNENDLVISATITDDHKDEAVSLYFKMNEETEFQRVSMEKIEESTYQKVFPKESLAIGTVEYFLMVTDQNHRVTYPSNNEETIEVTIEQVIPEVIDYNTYPHLLVTEISPNSAGGGTDYYEYFELYNNSNQPLTLTNYAFVYKYTDTRKEVQFQIPVVTIEPQETLVLWFNNGDKSLTDFNNHFATNLTSDQVVEYRDAFPGFANGGNRAIVIKNNEGTEVVSASYLGSENDNTGADISYKYPTTGTEMLKYQVLTTPTPGLIDSVQVPIQPVELEGTPTDSTAPIIEHEAIHDPAVAFSPVKVEARITDDVAVPLATLFYKEEGAASFKSVSMSAGSDPSNYSVEIPGTEVTKTLVYYIAATDGINEAQTEELKIEVEQSKVDFQQLPSFLVTEVLPDSTNVDGADGYEFIEIFNNTNKEINFKDYKINYRYGDDPNSDVVWASVPDDIIVPPGETLVFWIINAKNGNQTVADFNSVFGTSLVENQDIVRIHSAGMANGSMRGLVVATNTGKEVAVAYYNDVTNVDDSMPNKGIVYKYPTDKSTKMLKVSNGLLPATPGSLEEYQVPVKSVMVEEDTVQPTVQDLTTVSTVDQEDDIEIVAKADDNMSVKSVRLFYKTNGLEFSEAILKENYDDSLYHHVIYSPNLIGKEYVEYYFVVSDGKNEVTSDTKRISITNTIDDSSLRLNVKDGEIVKGEKVLKGTSKDSLPGDVKLSIDGLELIEGQYQSVENEVYIALEANGLNTYFKNAITMGDDVLYLMDKDWLSEWKTYKVAIEPERIVLGNNTITVRSGNKASPFDLESAENRDDYDLRNVRLILADGTVLRDAIYSDPNQVIKMNDANPFVDFQFEITEDHSRSKTYKWDTSSYKDGEHIVTVQDQDEEHSAAVLVDNTAPIIDTNVVEGKEYKGTIDITVDATDEIAGIDSVEVMLDDKKIEVPYQTSSGALAPGEHKLSVVATDKIGNQSDTIIYFSVVNENPLNPELDSQDETGDPKLRVKVTDPTGDDMDVTFYQGFKYDITNNVTAFANTSETEPPRMMVPQGEQSFNTDNKTLVAKKDGNYSITDSTTEFPYHRFDVMIDEAVDENDRVELEWSGNSLEGRKVSMYAWSHKTNNWNLIDYKIAEIEDFELKGRVEVSEYVKDAKINVLVQDEIPATPDEYDYTFVWMSDTQYYSESYPYIFDRQTQWIAEKQEEMKIKYVFHTGDLVDEADKEYQWLHADNYMKVLDDQEIPYGVLAGNHDVNQVTNDYTQYYQYFGENRFKEKPYYGGSYLNNRGHYDLISVDGNDYIMAYLGWGVTDEGIAWMNEVLAAHPDRKAILSFHEYLLSTGTRHPLGEKLYNEIVVPNENVIAVLSGHYHEAQTLIDRIDDNGDGTPDRAVYQMLADYQAGPEGGQGYMRLLHFDTDQNRVMVNTYSPYLDDYNYYDTDKYGAKDEFIMELDLEAKQKRVATDYFTVNVFTDTEIGKDENVPSGDFAEVTWTGLTEGQTYSWYAVSEDGHTGKTVSDIWSFVKGANVEVEPKPVPGDEVNPKPVEPGQGNGEEPKPADPGQGDGENPQPTEPAPNDGEDSGADKPENDNSSEKEDKEQTREETAHKDKSNEKGKTLPTTATNAFNLLLTGLIITLLGIWMRRGDGSRVSKG
ncbi:lamin tail domain-containing protein [Litchfieldia salsa]|uniref:Lamin Tail Domain n=1 Tax=Litchfieldia salsa TaxID=930152 RepID=A0A1H0Q5L2_9BACI|nr:lamin tail domain-containing protein [Litchfieldia salsa]SDP12701.1 Lamin Tail Domain [Litchfieldia salsa]